MIRPAATTAPPRGLHHITAIGREPGRLVRFYSQVLGLRLVKKTVNFDEPGTYHLYFGDRSGSPGSILTLFPFPSAAPGRAGAGQGGRIAFAVPEGALTFWRERLGGEAGIGVQAEEAFGQPRLSLADPDGLPLALVEDSTVATGEAWVTAGVPAEAAIQGFQSMALASAAPAATARLLTGPLGFEAAGDDEGRRRYIAPQPAGAPGRVIDLIDARDQPPGRMGAGTVHHIAYRVGDDEALLDRQTAVQQAGQQPTAVIDRQYFHSVYFREPGGILFELASDPPGFAVDEPPESLGENLKLPPRYEAQRARIEAALPPLRPA